MNKFLSILTTIINLIQEMGPIALPLVESLVNGATWLTPPEKLIIINILEHAFPPSGSSTFEGGVSAHDQVAALRSKWHF